MDVLKSTATRPAWRTQTGALLLSTAGIVVFGVGTWAYSDSALTEINVTVQKGDVSPSVVALGTVRPVGLKQLVARSAGQVVEIMVEPGAKVIAGTALLILRNDELASRVAAARLGHSKAVNLVAIARAQAKADESVEQSALLKAQIALDLAKEEFDARQLIFAQGVVSRMQVREAEARLRAASAELDAARTRIKAIRQLLDARVQLQLDEAEIAMDEYEQLRQQVEAQTIRAPSDGIVSEIQVDLGVAVSLGANLLKFVEGGGYFVELNVLETDIRVVRSGAPVDIELSGKMLTGKVARIHPAAKDGYVRVDITVDQKDASWLTIDSTAKARIEGETRSDVLYVNAVTGIRPNTEATLKVVHGEDAPQARKTIFGDRIGDKVIVTAGVAQGDVLVMAQRKMSSGDTDD